jgi:hypothetical protein
MTARELFTLLSRTPRQRWPDGVVHHGARILLLLVVAVATTMLFPVAPLADFPVLERGMVAEEDVIAEVPFSIYRPEAELARARQDAAAAERPIFVHDVRRRWTPCSRRWTASSRRWTACGHADSETAVRAGLRDLLTAYRAAPVVAERGAAGGPGAAPATAPRSA